MRIFVEMTEQEFAEFQASRCDSPAGQSQGSTPAPVASPAGAPGTSTPETKTKRGRGRPPGSKNKDSKDSKDKGSPSASAPATGEASGSSPAPATLPAGGKGGGAQEAPSREDVEAYLKEHARTFGVDKPKVKGVKATRELMKQYGAARFSDLADDDLPKIYADAKADFESQA